MPEILAGKSVADSIYDKLSKKISKLSRLGIKPCIASVRVGNNASDISYENGISKTCEMLDVEHKKVLLDDKITTDKLIAQIKKLNKDKSVHGVLIFRPLPKNIDNNKVLESLSCDKDIDGVTISSLSGIFTDRNIGYPPCTAMACVECLKYYDIDLTGKRVCIIGRSLVVGKPLSMLMLKENATVTICHSKTNSLREITKQSDIVIACVGKTKLIDDTYLKTGQIVIDVGINVDNSGKLCGDVDTVSAASMGCSVSPVPGGIGAITRAVLMRNLVDAADRAVNS